MTTFVNFAPAQSPSAPPFQFQATLDGANYTVTVKWNYAAQRWYISITDQSGDAILDRPLIGSPPTTLLSGLSWAGGKALAVAPSTLGFRVGSMVVYSITGALPAELSGVFPCTVTGDDTFTYEVDEDPGPVTVVGSYSIDSNLLGGFFETSTMVFRASTQNFEINP